MSTKNPCYDCGLCCSKLIVEIEHVDVVREPKLLPFVTLLDDSGEMKYANVWEKEYRLTCGNRCPMLGDDKKCGIHPTRPNVCVEFEVGGEECNELRLAAGLPQLTAI